MPIVLSDGVKTSVRGLLDSDGFEYLGSLIYARGSGGGLRLESAGFSAGRIMASHGSSTFYTPNYFITDHLGSVRAITDDDGNLLHTSDYYPFGLRWDDTRSLASDNRWLYNGKESQESLGMNYLDYGARMYDPRIGRWHSPDPLAEKYYSVSPYIYTLNNPIVYIDPNGMIVDMSRLSADDRENFQQKVDQYRLESVLFDANFSFLENSSFTYFIEFGNIRGDAEGVFVSNKNEGGGVIKFDPQSSLGIRVVGEEFFHAFQHESMFAIIAEQMGLMNMEAEAKLATWLMSMEGFNPTPLEPGMDELTVNMIKDKYNGPHGTGGNFIEKIVFYSDYIEAVNKFATYNIENNRGNIHYKRGNMLPPLNLLRLINSIKKR